MFRNNIVTKGIFTIILFITMGVSQVSLEIKNVDLTAGTLDIVMTNTAGCSYCPNTTYNNNTQDWWDQKGYCEQPAPFGDTTWVSFENITEDACAAIPGFQGDGADPINGGWWFDGNVGGFQFELSGVTITDASSPTVLTASNGVTTNEDNAGAALLVGFSFDAASIPAGSETLLTQITFTDFDGVGICFGEDEGGDGFNVVSNGTGGYIAADWGDCYCGSDSPVDCAGICGGTTVDSDEDGVCNVDDTCPDNIDNDSDGDGVCDDACPNSEAGATVDPDTGCEPTASISQIGLGLPDEFSITQNFPNPFNPATSIAFDVVGMDEVSLIVYDITGKEVVTLVSGMYTPGTYNVVWNAVNNAGDNIVSGMYIYRYVSGNKAITKKMLYLK